MKRGKLRKSTATTGCSRPLRQECHGHRQDEMAISRSAARAGDALSKTHRCGAGEHQTSSG